MFFFFNDTATTEIYTLPYTTLFRSETNAIQTPTVGIASSPIPEAPAKATIDSDFETFLIMLTTQMKIQDPLNPIDSSDFAVQLATFSSVEQQVKTNDLLASLGQQLGFMGLSRLARSEERRVGKERRSRWWPDH